MVVETAGKRHRAYLHRLLYHDNIYIYISVTKNIRNPLPPQIRNLITCGLGITLFMRVVKCSNIDLYIIMDDIYECINLPIFCSIIASKFVVEYLFCVVTTHAAQAHTGHHDSLGTGWLVQVSL